MQRARAFFLVCAGLFLLALAYHLGAQSAGAQAGSGLVVAGDFEDNRTVVCVGRTVYMTYADPPETTTYPSVPGTAPVIAVGFNTYEDKVVAILSNGDTYAAVYNTGGPWAFIYNAVGSLATSAQSISIGQLKAKYAK